MEDLKLWRYYDLVKFFALINGEIYFARADTFDDRYEGAMPKRNFQEHVEWMGYGVDKLEKDLVKREFEKKFDEKKKKAAISCWHINESESAAMWEIYSKGGHGIAVRTRMSKLNAAIQKPNDYELEGFKVKYIDFDLEYKADYNYFELLPFMNKRLEFEHEHEYRLMLYQHNLNSRPFKDGISMKANEIVRYGYVSKLNDIPEDGIAIKVDPSSIIDEILASPYMKSYELSIIQKLLDLINNANGTDFIIKRSKLYDKLAY